MLFRLAIYASICVSLVSGHSVYTPEQEILPATYEPFTINVQAEISVVRPAEIAKIEANIKAFGVTEDETLEQVALARDRVESVLNAWSAQAGRPVKTWKGSKVHMERRSPGHSMAMMDDAEFVDETPAHKYKARASYSIEFHRLELIEEFSTNLVSSTDGSTSSYQVNIDYIDWQLTEETSAEAKAELRVKAVEQLMKEGKEYAGAFRSTVGRPLEFHDEYTYTDTQSRRWYSYWENDYVNLQPPELEMRTTVRCKFSTNV